MHTQLQNFAQNDNSYTLKNKTFEFLNALGYKSFRTNNELDWTKIQDSWNVPFTQNEKDSLKYVVSANFIFQITDQEVKDNMQNDMFGATNTDNKNRIDVNNINSYLFFCVKLQDKQEYRRNTLTTLTQYINKVFPIPVFVLFQYDHNISLAVINRQINKTDRTKETLGKVSMLKDIDVQQPKRSHIETLQDLNLLQIKEKNKGVNSFLELHKAWTKILDINALNNKFFQEIANWYFWAVANVKFPFEYLRNSMEGKDKNDDTLQELANKKALISMLTRLVFVWFIKEKKLVNESLFDEYFVKNILQNEHENAYYKAILQNLFFATLNKPKENRAFASDEGFAKNRSTNEVKSLYRYEKLFKKDFLNHININPKNSFSKNLSENHTDAIMSIFQDTPFLNGGLFECTDKEGFSRTENKQAEMPDVLFFREKPLNAKNNIETDPNIQILLNKAYQTNNKKYDFVQGIVQILKKYKFTIEENTPLEEDIALDPELLGRIFENLLAYYNPETGETARKGTGSFYTPREIVEYMVNESLVAYLQNIAPNENQRLHDLMDYAKEGHDFDTQTTQNIINALAHIKILDPACGSGAFPMGIVQKIVFILRKLDKDNSAWRNVQKQIVSKEIDNAYDISNSEERQAKLLEIDNLFVKNMEDYGRKLFIIQNCIFGVDIQTTAIQISKLRFFLSLVIEQKPDFQNPNNYGIETLPNLETKIISANSLIAPEKIQTTHQLFDEVAKEKLKLIKQRASIRERFFRANDRNTKNKLIEQENNIVQNLITQFENTTNQAIRTAQNKINEQDVFLREQEKSLKKAKENYNNSKKEDENIKSLQKNITTTKSEIQTLTHEIQTLTTNFQNFKTTIQWNPYNQEQTATWFDPKEMFDVDGFDIVIGNPPYGADLTQEEKIYFTKNYKKQDYQLDTYLLFTEKSFYLLRENGVTSFVIPNTWLINLRLKKFRTFLLTETNIIEISHYEKNVFQAVVNTDVLIFKKNLEQNHKVKIRVIEKNKTNIFYQNQYKWKENNGEPINIFIDETTQNIIDKIKLNTFPIADFCNVVSGMKPYQKGKGKPIQSEQMVKNRIYDADYRVDESYKALLRGSDIAKYTTKWDEKRWIKYGEHLAEPRQSAKFDAEEKIVIRQTSDTLIATLDTKQFVCMNNMHVITKKDNGLLSLKFILALLNSKLLDFYHQCLNPEKGEILAEIKKENVEKLLVPQIPLSSQKPFELLVDYVLWLRSHEGLLESVEDKVMSGFFENVINGCVYELYFGEEMREANQDILQYLGNLPSIEHKTDNETLAVIRKIYVILSERNHPVAQRIYYMDSVPVVRVIKGLTTN